ncbi:MAG: hypothetical protein COT74_09300 [Bdellovibrionales bacterium CG10_big_fil_rev_8_21_14_0_10_45_34]|nr:MAG: hypothetical protein COT74_09300 [Bdellovibrionales bacterium CG10_big_fil_rev_8_21_14_0_10_45_34]
MALSLLLASCGQPLTTATQAPASTEGSTNGGQTCPSKAEIRNSIFDEIYKNAETANNYTAVQVSLQAHSSKIVSSLSHKWKLVDDTSLKGFSVESENEILSLVSKSLSGISSASSYVVLDHRAAIIDEARYVAGVTGQPAKVRFKSLQQSPMSPDEALIAIASLEAGNRTTQSAIEAQEHIDAAVSAIESKLIASGVCSPGLPGPTEGSAGGDSPSGGDVPQYTDLLSYWKASLNPAVYGAWKAFSVAYQNCDAISRPPLTASSPYTEGIVEQGRNPDNGGVLRVISSLEKVNATHPYASGWLRQNDSCFHLPSSPLIYDFGGKPKATSSVDSNLDYFSNSGSGSKALGTDCTGYVFSALASAGLRLTTSGRLRAISVNAYHSSYFAKPEALPFDCLNRIEVSASHSILAGDIVAINGHVFIIDQVGEDPFGLRKKKTSESCTLSSIDVSDFDFYLAQSSPSKGAVGINRFRGSDYLNSSPSMAQIVKLYAVEACKSLFDGITRRPKFSSGAITRHKGTPECIDRPIELARESCVAACPL